MSVEEKTFRGRTVGERRKCQLNLINHLPQPFTATMGHGSDKLYVTHTVSRASSYLVWSTAELRFPPSLSLESLLTLSAGSTPQFSNRNGPREDTLTQDLVIKVPRSRPSSSASPSTVARFRCNPSTCRLRSGRRMGRPMSSIWSTSCHM
jgi:hypothetical protein